MHHAGVVRSRERRTAQSLIRSDGMPVSEDVPEVIRDKLEMVQDPVGFKQRLLNRPLQKRTILTSPAAVLKPSPRKGGKGGKSNRPVNHK